MGRRPVGMAAMIAIFTIIVLLIAINALYVAAEFAAVGVRHSRMRQLAEEGNSLAALLLPWLEDGRKLDRFIAACQVGITLSSLLLGAYSQAALVYPLADFLARWAGLLPLAAHSTASVTVLVFLTATQVVMGELVPKSLALQYSTQTALFTFLPMRWSLRLFSWLIALLNGSGLIILKLLRVPYSGHRHIHSPEEIEMLIADSRDGGVLEPDEHLRLQRALRLGVRSAHQLMVPRRFMASINIDMPVESVIREITNSPYSHIPVYRGSVDNVIGILHTKDVVLHFIRNGHIRSVAEVMKPVLNAPENVTADSLLTLFRQKRCHQAVVVDEFGGTEGLITLEDVLSELLGEVADEFKRDQPRPEKLPDGRVRLPGLMRTDEAEPWLGVLWEGEADTIGGRVVEAMGRVPVAQECLIIDGVKVEIEQISHHAIASILATPVSREEEAAESESGGKSE